MAKEILVLEGSNEVVRLTKAQVLAVVKEWYINGMCIDIFETEDGQDLEEWAEQRQDHYGWVEVETINY